MNSSVVILRAMRVVAPVAAIGCVLSALPSMAQTPKPIDARIKHQDVRIKAAVKTHQINHAQAHALMAKENHIKAKVAVEREKNGGHLTPAEHAKMEHHLNNVSKDITKAKMDH